MTILPQIVGATIRRHWFILNIASLEFLAFVWFWYKSGNPVGLIPTLVSAVLLLVISITPFIQMRELREKFVLSDGLSTFGLAGQLSWFLLKSTLLCTLAGIVYIAFFYVAFITNVNTINNVVELTAHQNLTVSLILLPFHFAMTFFTFSGFAFVIAQGNTANSIHGTFAIIRKIWLPTLVVILVMFLPTMLELGLLLPAESSPFLATILNGIHMPFIPFTYLAAVAGPVYLAKKIREYDQTKKIAV